MDALEFVKGIWRPKRLHITSITGAFSKLTTAVSQVVSIYLVTSYGGLEIYGAFGLLTGLTSWYLLADFGLGSVIQNKISGLVANGRDYEAVVFRAYILIIALSASLILIFFLSRHQLGGILLGAFEISEDLKGNLFFAASASYLSITLAGVYLKILFGEGRGYIANIISIVAAILGLAGLVTFVNSESSSISLLSLLSIYLLPNYAIPLMFFSARLYRARIKGPLSKSRFSGFTRADYQLASKFFIIAVSAAAVAQVDIFFIAVLLEPEGISAYLMTGKLFTLVYFIYGAFLQSIWPEISASYAIKDVGRIRMIIRETLKRAALFFTLFATAIFFSRNYLVGILSSGALTEVSDNLVLAFGVLTLARLWTDIYSTTLQACSDLNVFICAIIIQAVINFALIYCLASRFGAVGIVCAIFLAYILTVSWALPWATLRLLRRTPSHGSY